MNITVIREKWTEDYTIGEIHIDGVYECKTLEDGKHAVKIPGETAIPVGLFELNYLQHDSPLTKRYRKRFSWFTKHLHLKNVPNFEWIYIHIGNTIQDTRGCILVGEEIVPHKGLFALKRSTAAYEKLYKKVQAALDRNERVTIEVFEKKPKEAVQKPDHKGVIMDFLFEKENDFFGDTGDKFKKYPIQASRGYGYELETYYIQDAMVERNGLEHKLTVSLLDEAGKGYILKKYCRADCPIDWDTVTCAFNLQMK